MAEKEERIWIDYPLPKNACAIESRRCTTMTRQEAIERMAKAMCHNPYESCEGCIAQKKKQACKQALEGMKELAEAALNALLEVEK